MGKYVIGDILLNGSGAQHVLLERQTQSASLRGLRKCGRGRTIRFNWVRNTYFPFSGKEVFPFLGKFSNFQLLNSSIPVVPVCSRIAANGQFRDHVVCEGKPCAAVEIKDWFGKSFRKEQQNRRAIQPSQRPFRIDPPEILIASCFNISANRKRMGTP